MKESGKLAIMAGVSALALLLMRGKKTTISKPRIHPKKRTYDDVEDDPEQAEAVGRVPGVDEVTVFRTYPDGEVIALFPNLDEGGGNCLSYMHWGQHGAAYFDRVIRDTRPSTESEIKPLLRELEMIGYRPIVRNEVSVGAVKSKAPKFYVYAGYYELFISTQPMPAPYVLLKTFRKIDRAIEYAESFDDNVVYCENVKDYLPTFLYEVLQDSDYEYFVY